MKKIALILLAFSVTTVSFAQTSSNETHARQLLELTGSGKLGMQVIGNMMATYKRNLPNVPSEFWDEVGKEFNADELINLLVPIYVKHYTDEEMVKLIEFYRSPLGQKVIEKLPLISQDSYKAGEAWGKKIGEKVVEKLLEKGFTNNQ